MADDRLAGQALATRRAVTDIVRTVTLGSYGVVDLGGSRLARWLGTMTGRPAGVRVSLAGGGIAIDLRLRVAHGVPIAEVARQVDSAVRFAIRRALRREVDRLTIRVAALSVRPASQPPRPPASTATGSSELADSGTDVA
ncbi:MAG TPA: Asp23/Gls24 family envelope stress response protein [Candidatus Limnocylindrales bacterium]|nr:Asp23/Gls24 family envelope stress response protein [Candidatus Limnocylindrales bacterium]